MKHVSVRLIGLVTSLIIILTLTIGQAPEKAEAAVPTCAVPSGMFYNIPDPAGGTAAQQYKHHRLMACMFKAAPKGSNITISAYSWNDDASSNALLAADARGVNVRIAMWKARESVTTAKFAKAFNDGKTKGSWFKSCFNACLGPNGGAVNVHHTKIVNFSRVNTPRGKYVSNVTVIGTSNFSLSNGSISWNTWRVIPNNPTLYKGTTAYVGRMKADRDQRTTTATRIVSGATTIHLYPTKKGPDRQLALLNATSCKGGKTFIRSATYTWTDGRLAIAKRMAALKRAGCSVKVIINYDSSLIGKQVLSTLLGSKVEVWNAHAHGLHTHDKGLYIRGPIAGKSRNITLSGSQNWTNNAIYGGDELLYEIESYNVLNQHFSLWNRWQKSAVRVTASSKISRTDGVDLTPTVHIPTTNDPALKEENQ